MLGCQVCNGGKETLYQETRYVKMSLNTFGEARTILIECDGLCPPHSNCCMKGIPFRSAFIINFCPECGRKLSKEDSQ